MNSWLGFFTAWRPSATHEPGKLTRLVDLMTRGSTPVDGFTEKKPGSGPERRAEPVRWGNFR